MISTKELQDYFGMTKKEFESSSSSDKLYYKSHKTSP